MHAAQKDGKEHRYWSIVENRRCAGGKIVQRPVLYLARSMTASVRGGAESLKLSTRIAASRELWPLFAWDRKVPDHAADYGVQVRLKEFELHRARQWGACWLGCELYEQLGLDEFWAARSAR